MPPARLRPRRGWLLREDHDRGDDEHDDQQREREPLEDVHEVVPEEGDGDLRDHDDDQAELSWAGVVSVARANAPLTLLTANQPMPATTALRPAGRMLPRKPKPIRLSTICGTPNAGPRGGEHGHARSSRARCRARSRAPPARTTGRRSRRRMMPTKMVANSRFGDTQVQNMLIGLAVPFVQAG